MALVKRKEFADICGPGTTVGIINTNVSRKKIDVLENGLVDTENPLNKIFIKARKQMQKSAKEKVPKKDVIDNIISKKKKAQEFHSYVPTKDELIKIEEAKKTAEKQLHWSQKKDKADADKAVTDAELKKLQLEKMMGALMPVDLMHHIFKINIQNIFITFENECVNLASIYCDIMAGGDRGKLSEVIDKMRKELSRIIKETNINAAKEIKGVIAEYSETRNRGQRK